METALQIKQWAKELKATAQTGMAYGKDVFDLERYEQMDNLANEMLAKISGMDTGAIKALLPIETGYATPKIACRGLVFQDDKLLMVKEAADGNWCLPGGWCDVGLTPAENIVKEIHEETGMEVQAARLVALFDQTKYRKSVTMQHIYTAYFSCDVEGGSLRGSIETQDVGYFSLDELPPFSKERMTMEQLRKALDASKAGMVYFD